MRALLTTGAVLLALCAAAPADDLTPQRRQELEKKSAELTTEGEQQYQRGDYGKAGELFREALELRRTLYPKDKYPQGHADLAYSLNNLGLLHWAAGAHAQAEAAYREALEMYRALYSKEKFPQGQPDLANTVSNLGLL